MFSNALFGLQVPPTRMNLTLYKGKYVAAKKGYDLLKNKADALKVIRSNFSKNFVRICHFFYLWYCV